MVAHDNEPVVEGPPGGEGREVTHRALQNRIQQQECLAELGVVALRGGSLDMLLSEGVRLTAEGLHTQFCKVLEHIPSEHRFLVRAGIGWGQNVVGVATVGDDLESPAGYALRTKRPVISNHLEHEERFRTPEILQRFGIRRAMNVILQGDGRPYGVLEVDSQSDDEFQKADLAFLQGVANVLGMAIERERHERSLNLALERHQYLLKEMNHRIKNSLTIVSSVLGLQARQAGDPAVAAHLKEAVNRIAAIAKAHEWLYQGSEVEWLDIGKYIESVCRDLGASLSKHQIRINTDHGIEVATDQAITTALIVNELITNSVKYAYPNEGGEIAVTLVGAKDGGFAIYIRDKGVGLPEDFDARKPSGLGMRLVAALVQQLHGNLDIRKADPGTEVCVTVPNKRHPSSGENPSETIFTT